MKLGRMKLLLAGWLAGWVFSALAAPLPKEALPDSLRPWVPWVMHGNETLACPPAHDDGSTRQCVWPSELALQLEGKGGRFTYRVEVFAPDQVLMLPGDDTAWPTEVKSNGRSLAVVALEDRPTVRLPRGNHLISGDFAWTKPPASLSLPPASGLLKASFNGKPLAAPDKEGQLWLQAEKQDEAGADSLSLRVFRQIDDAIPLQAVSRFELAVAGRPREVVLPMALLPEFLPLGLDSPLPARLDAQGRLHVQVRAGTWNVSVTGRLMHATDKLSLPEASAVTEEIWSFAAHNELRLVNVSGPPAIDPKQAGVPDDWSRLPAYRLQPGQSLNLETRRRGDPEPAPDKLSLNRVLWLDFDGGGFTLQDRIKGSLSRSFRLEVAAPVQLGRAEVDGQDQFVTQLAGKEARGVEVRGGTANLVADSRIEGSVRSLPVSGWQADFNEVGAVLGLPPGWRLIHAGGADRAEGSWISRWTLWDFFFVLLLTVAAHRLYGLKAAALLGAGLVLSWHLPDAPHRLWLALLICAALARAAAQHRLGRYALWAERACLGLILLVLLPFAVHQVRSSLYPSLERGGSGFVVPMAMPGVAKQTEPAPEPPVMADNRVAPMAPPAPAAAPATAPAAAPADVMEQAAGALSSSASSAAASRLRSKPAGAGYKKDYSYLANSDPSARIQTGPGLPSWNWRQHHLYWQGPVDRQQILSLWLLPPWATALVNILTLALLFPAWWRLAGRPGRERLPLPKSWTGLAALIGFAVGASLMQPDAAQAATPKPAESASEVTPRAPSPAILEQMRTKLTAPADCLPNCADMSRLWLGLREHRLQLRAELHAQAVVMVPLPGGEQWRPEQVRLDGKPAALRRDEQGQLWLYLPAGVHQATLESDVRGDGLQIALPLSPRHISADLAGWTLSGLDADGKASGALTLNRQAAADAKGGAKAGDGDSQDKLPPFVQVERVLQLGQRWTVQTAISRLGPGQAPLNVRIPMLADEAVTDGSVKVETVAGQSVAVLTLPAGEGAGFSSTLKPQAKLQLTAGQEPNQIEVWRLEASPLWHADFAGIAPTQRLAGNQWQPQWQPWPGEQAALNLSRPAGVAGQTLTLDSSELRVTPGVRASDLSLTLVLRSSQGGSHKLTLPEGAELLAVNINGQDQPIRAEGRLLTLPIVPGRQNIKLDWREPGGMSVFFRTPEFDLGLAGVNASLVFQLPQDRWLLALGGPLLGPAVLFWGLALVLAGAALALGRSKLTPLGFVSWLLFGLGLILDSLAGFVLVAGFFLALSARGRSGERLLAYGSRWPFNLAQLGLALWAVLAALSIFGAIHSGLLGAPDMLVQGNGSSDHVFHWYADHSNGPLPTAWVLALPLWLWRVLMLAWALWLASRLVRWLRWGWDQFASHGLWRPAPAKPAPNPETRDGRTLLGRRKKPIPPTEASKDDTVQTPET